MQSLVFRQPFGDATENVMRVFNYDCEATDTTKTAVVLEVCELGRLYLFHDGHVKIENVLKVAKADVHIMVQS